MDWCFESIDFVAVAVEEGHYLFIIKPNIITIITIIVLLMLLLLNAVAECCCCWNWLSSSCSSRQTKKRALWRVEDWAMIVSFTMSWIWSRYLYMNCVGKSTSLNRKIFCQNTSVLSKSYTYTIRTGASFLHVIKSQDNFNVLFATQDMIYYIKLHFSTKSQC